MVAFIPFLRARRLLPERVVFAGHPVNGHGSAIGPIVRCGGSTVSWNSFGKRCTARGTPVRLSRYIPDDRSPLCRAGFCHSFLRTVDRSRVPGHTAARFDAATDNQSTSTTRGGCPYGELRVPVQDADRTRATMEADIFAKNPRIALTWVDVAPVDKPVRFEIKSARIERIGENHSSLLSGYLGSAGGRRSLAAGLVLMVAIAALLGWRTVVARRRR